MSSITFDELAEILSAESNTSNTAAGAQQDARATQRGERPQRAFSITPQQQCILNAPLKPVLVTAGAGSGKTQTMMLRMLWLVANEGMHPSEILGLTFTRKAAGELRERVEQNLARLRLHLPFKNGKPLFGEFDVPRVSTYNSFANEVYGEYALLLGHDPQARVLDEARAFALMRAVVLDYDGVVAPELEDKSVADMTKSALRFARDLRENRCTGAQVDSYREITLDQLTKLGGGDITNLTKTIREAINVDNLKQLETFVHLADIYQRRKTELGVIEFSDQVAAAADIIELDPSIAEEIRGDIKQVILDEYQDTSAGQTRFLSGLFNDTAVMAVGDPKQSIYAWRGASAANMKRFSEDFTSDDNAQVLSLSTSWRNDESILKAANTIASQLPTLERGDDLSVRPNAGRGEVRCERLLTDLDEARRVAEWFSQKLRAEQQATGVVLVRARKQMRIVADALAAQGVQYEIVGLGGLLNTPEIIDLVALLRAATDEYAGNHALRMLLGARFELSLADVDALATVARRFAQAGENAPGEESGGFSLIEAVEYVRHLDDDEVQHKVPGLSVEGTKRVREVADLLQQIRERLDLPLVEWVSATISLSRLDVETVANPQRAVGRENLDLFVQAVADYAQSVENADINGFLDWLEYSSEEDRLGEFVETPPKQGLVQLTTIHSAKGLQWDYVAVIGLSEKVLPDLGVRKAAFVAGRLPDALRADAADLPQLLFDGIRDKTALAAEYPDLDKHPLPTDPDVDVRSLPYLHQLKLSILREDRRLAYVAFTRARFGLLVTQCVWRKGKAKPLAPSRFLLEIDPEAPLLHWNEDGEWEEVDEWLSEKGAGNPMEGDATTVPWPLPAMSDERREQLRDLAAQVEQRAGGDEAQRTSEYDELIDLLLAQRRAAAEPAPLHLPERFGASALHDITADPRAFAMQVRRPVPRRPYRATLVGTLFHQWVEGLYRDVAAGGGILEGADPDDGDVTEALRATAEDLEVLQQLQDTFRASRFAKDGRRPIAVELPLEMPLGTRRLIAKIDAVYRDGDTIEIVDWKTGRAPASPAEVRARELQLMAYAHAYALAYDVPVERIRATLYYVAADKEHIVEPGELLPLDELERLIDTADASLSYPTATGEGATAEQEVATG